jgi:tetratricopeptide (TPR) repeat protein
MSTWQSACIHLTQDGPSYEFVHQSRYGGGRVRRTCLAFCLLMTLCGCLWCQNDARQQLQRANSLEQNGQFEQAVDILRPLALSRQLTAAETGRAKILLGFAYQEENDLANARNAYEQAVRLFRDEPSQKADYATALDNLANWFRVTGSLRAAKKLDKNALEQYEEAGDHAGAAWSSLHLAVLELTHKRQIDAELDLDKADNEAELVQNRDDGFFAALYSAKGWLAELKGQSRTAIFDYTQSIALRDCKTCVLTGWEYALLGRAYANDGQLSSGLSNLRKGLAILGDSPGPRSRRYLAAEMAYSQVLDEAGEHAESAAVKSSAENESIVLDGKKCIACREGFESLR